MSRLSRGQKMRLGIFLISAFTLLFGAIVFLVGATIFEQRDAYVIRFTGATSGLDVGAPVKFNGVPMGRVESIRIDEADVTGVEVWITMKGGTPIKEDHRATLAMQGITGLKSIELSGGTNESRTLKPGEEIQSEVSTLDMLADRVGSIAAEIENLISNLVKMTGGETQKELTAAIHEVRMTAASVRKLFDGLDARSERLVVKTEELTGQLTQVVSEVTLTLTSFRESTERVSRWIDRPLLARLMKSLDATAKNIGARTSKDELGEMMAATTKLAERTSSLVGHLDLALLRLKDDLARAMDEFVVGAENFSDFAQLLRDDPSALLRGRSEKERVIK